MTVPETLKYVKSDQENPKTFVLKRPVSFKGGTLSEITLREPTAAQVIGAASLLQDETRDGQTAWLQQIVASVGKISPVTALDDVPYSELMLMGIYLGEFISNRYRGDGVEKVKTSELDATWDMELTTPVSVGGLDYSVVSLQEPTITQLKKAQGQLRRGQNELTYRNFQMHLVANVSGLPLAVVAAMPISDLNAGASYLEVFTDRGQVTM